MNHFFHRTLYHANFTPTSKLLRTPTRNAHIAGRALRKAHERIGYYLATQYLSQILGLEMYDIPHVQGHATDGQLSWEAGEGSVR